jgi:peptidyl-prolyl cis-trans isomerase C
MPMLSMPAVMKPIRWGLSLSLLVLAACQQTGNAPDAALLSIAAPVPVPEEGAIIARVDGSPIHEAWLKALARGRNLDLSDPAQRARALDELLEYAVLVNAARHRPELAAPDIRADIELNALAARANTVLAQIGAVQGPDDAALRTEYDKQLQANGDTEYRVSYMLFTDETNALAAASAIAGGRAYDDVATEFRNRTRQAEDLEWFKLGQVPQAFADAVRALQPGQTTTAPVKTDYGWHVIRLRETRPFTPPAFEQVREGIRRMLIMQASREAVAALKEGARIEIIEPAQ